MIPLSIEKKVTLVCTADPDVKVKRKKPVRLVPIEEATINGGTPLSFVVRTLNSEEQTEVAAASESGKSLFKALKLGVMAVGGERNGTTFTVEDPEEVYDVLKTVPSSITGMLSTWIIQNSWGEDPLVPQK